MPVKVAPKAKQTPTTKGAVNEKVKAQAERDALLLKLAPQFVELAGTVTESRLTMESSRLQLGLEMRDVRIENKLSPDEVTKLLRIAYAEAGDFPASDFETTAGRALHSSEYSDITNLKTIVCHKCSDAEFDKMLKRIEKGEKFAFRAIKDFAADPKGKASAIVIKQKPGKKKGDKRNGKGDGEKKQFATMEDVVDSVKKTLTAARNEEYDKDELIEAIEELLAEFAATEDEPEDDDKK